MRAGAGLAELPCFLAAGADNLERLLAAEVRTLRTFWVSTHHDIKGTPRIRAVLAWLAELAAAIRPVLLPTVG